MSYLSTQFQNWKEKKEVTEELGLSKWSVSDLTKENNFSAIVWFLLIKIFWSYFGIYSADT